LQIKQHTNGKARLSDNSRLSGRQLGHPGRNGYGRFVGSSHDVALLVMDSLNPDHLKALARQRMKAVVNYDFT
jgi:hypothetical protein